VAGSSTMQHLVQVEEGREAADGAPSAGPTYRCAAGGKGGAPPAVPGLDCCWDIFRLSVEKCPDNKMLGRREIVDGKAGNYTWLTYKEVYDTVIKVGAAIRSCGVGKVQTFVLIIALRPSIPRSWNLVVPYFHYSLNIYGVLMGC